MFGRISPLFLVLTFVMIVFLAGVTYYSILGDYKEPKANTAAQLKKEQEAAARNQTIGVVAVCVMLVVFAGIGAKMYMGYKARTNPPEVPLTEEEIWAQKRANDPDAGSS